MRGLGRRVGDGITVLGIALMLSSCGGGGGTTSGSGGTGPVVVTPTPTPTPTASNACSLRARQDWVLAQFDEWYLFPETMAYVNPAGFSDLLDYVDALAAGARAQGRDRYFSYVTSIAAENAYYMSGETAGFGFRLYTDAAARRLFVSEAFEGAPALAAGIDRGAEILAIGTSAATLRNVSDIIAAQGDYGLYLALGADLDGTRRFFRISDAGGTRVVELAKATFEIDPVSPRYGARILDRGGRKVGYVNLRTFIYTAEAQLRAAFAQLKAQGVEDVVVDLRYNGGGALSVAQTLGSLLGGARSSSDIFTRLRFRPSKTAENEDYRFQPEASAIAPRRMAFITSEGSASASEMVVNAFRPFMPDAIALIGENSYGKPVGQIALDKPECDDRLRIIAFAVENAAGESSYYGGLAPLMAHSCRARDELGYGLGDADEDMMARALDFIEGRSCTPISGTGIARTASAAADRTGGAAPPVLKPLVPPQPSQPQRDMPGFF